MNPESEEDVMKKLIALLTVTLMTVLAFAAPVSAAAQESDITAALKNAGVAQTYISQAESYMAQEGVNLTEVQITGIVTDINDAVAIAAGQKDYAKLTSAQKSGIALEIAHAASLLGLTSKYDKTNGVSITDSTGKVLISVTSANVKKTGFDYTLIFAGVAVMVTAIISAFVLRRVSGSRKMEYNHQ